MICLKRKTRYLFSLLASLAFLCVESVLAQTIVEGDQLFLRGEYREALEVYQKVNNVDGVIAASKTLRMTGKYRLAESLCRDNLKKYDNHPRLNTELAEALFVQGNYTEATGLLKTVVDRRDAPLRALVVYADYLHYLGNKAEAEIIYSAASASYSALSYPNPDQVALAARATWKQGDFQGANNLFRNALAVDPRNMEAQTWWGDMLAEKHQEAEAQGAYQDVLRQNRYYVPALIGLAKIARNDKLLEDALFVNNRSEIIYHTYAELSLKQNKFREARSYLNAALPNNERSIEVLTALAGVAIVLDEKAEYEKWRKEVEALRPLGGEFYTTIAGYFSNDYRFQEAVDFARQAIAIEADFWPAHTLLGMDLIRLGEEKEGRQVLELAFENDPYDYLTSNMLKVFDTLDGYTTLNSKNFIVHMDEEDALVLWPYMEPLLEEAWQKLVEKYGFTPDGKVLIEVFKNREDFAVRSVGLPDLGPLVGICFGKVITLISPDTLQANWQEIVWHEFAHIITLQMTKNRMPRWLSEGISVYEEKEGRPEWGRRQDMDVVRALEDRRFFPIERIDDAFLRARSDEDLNLAYLQSYLMVQHVVDDYGFNKLKDLIKAYGTFADTETIVKDTFALSVKEFDQGFNRWLEKRVEDVDVYVHVEDNADEGTAHGHGARSNSAAVLSELYSTNAVETHMRNRILAEPRDFQAHLQLGIVLFKAKRYEEAVDILEEAKKILPWYSAYPSPPLVLSQIYEATGDEEKRLKELEYMVKYNQHDFDANIEIARKAIAEKEFEKANYHLQRAIGVDPYVLEIHQLLAQVAEAIDKPEIAIREYEILTVLDKTDPVNSYTRLAKAYLQGGKKAQAKYNSLRALEIAPTYRAAQEVLLQTVDGE